MPLPGGDADKAGNRYELRWTVRQFIRLLTDDAVWIELEPVGEEGERIEFRLCRSDGEIEAHQVKRQQAGKAHWTIADLARDHVLEGLCKHALDNDAELVFVSTQPTKSLPELRDRAQTITDFSAFLQSLSLDLRSDFDDLQRRLGIDSAEETWRAVRQSRWIPADERGLGDTVLALLGAYLTGDSEAALGVLSVFALEAVHRRVTAGELLDVLAQRGIGPSDVTSGENGPGSISSGENGPGSISCNQREGPNSHGCSWSVPAATAGPAWCLHRDPKLTATVGRRWAAIGQKPRLTPAVQDGRIRPKGGGNRTCAATARDATTCDDPGDPHRSAGVSYFWITWPLGVLSGNRIINCWASEQIHVA